MQIFYMTSKNASCIPLNVLPPDRRSKSRYPKCARQTFLRGGTSHAACMRSYFYCKKHAEDLAWDDLTQDHFTQNKKASRYKAPLLSQDLFPFHCAFPLCVPSEPRPPTCRSDLSSCGARAPDSKGPATTVMPLAQRIPPRRSRP